MSHSQRGHDPLQAVKDIVGDSRLLIAFAGAVVSALTAFVPFSTLIGGLLAGWLVRDDTSKGALVGAVSGVILLLPFSFFGFVVFGFAAFDSIAGGIGFLVVLVVLGVFALLYVVAPAAVGGYLGTKLYQDRTGGNDRGFHGHHDHDEDDGWGDDDGWGSDDGGVGGDGGGFGGGDGGGGGGE